MTLRHYAFLLKQVIGQETWKSASAQDKHQLKTSHTSGPQNVSFPSYYCSKQASIDIRESCYSLGCEFAFPLLSALDQDPFFTFTCGSSQRAFSSCGEDSHRHDCGVDSSADTASSSCTNPAEGGNTSQKLTPRKPADIPKPKQNSNTKEATFASSSSKTAAKSNTSQKFKPRKPANVPKPKQGFRTQEAVFASSLNKTAKQKQEFSKFAEEAAFESTSESKAWTGSRIDCEGSACRVRSDLSSAEGETKPQHTTTMGARQTIVASSVDMSSRDAEMVKKTIESNPVVVFSKSQCPFCVRAKGIIQGQGVDCKVMELDHMEQGNHIQDILEKMTSARTVPRVFINGQCIGGCSELQQLEKSGKLSEMFQSMQY